MTIILTALATAVFIVLFVILFLVLQNFLLPRLQSSVQAYLVGLGALVVLVVGFLASLAQITGYSVRDLFSSSPSSNDQTKTGQMDQTTEKEKLKADRKKAESLIDEIQSSLYGDDSRLPQVLTLCLALCDVVHLTDEYGEWVRRELSGYHDAEEFRKGFGDEAKFEAWMGRWMKHRLADTYVKFQYYSQETGLPETMKMPFKKMLISHPVGKIAEMVQDARNGHMYEIALPLVELSSDYFDELKAFVEKYPMKIQMSRDLRVFFSAAELEKALNGVRDLVLSLLSRTRREIL